MIYGEWNQVNPPPPPCLNRIFDNSGKLFYNSDMRINRLYREQVNNCFMNFIEFILMVTLPTQPYVLNA